MDLSEKFIHLITNKPHIKLSELEIKDLEIGIFNWTIDFSEKNQIIKNWDNKKFKKAYINKCVSVISNLDSKLYLKNKSLYKRLKNGEFLPHEIIIYLYKIFILKDGIIL